MKSIFSFLTLLIMLNPAQTQSITDTINKQALLNANHFSDLFNRIPDKYFVKDFTLAYHAGTIEPIVIFNNGGEFSPKTLQVISSVKRGRTIKIYNIHLGLRGRSSNFKALFPALSIYIE